MKIGKTKTEATSKPKLKVMALSKKEEESVKIIR